MTQPGNNSGIWQDSSAGKVTISRTITFNSAVGTGAIGAVPLFTMNGPTGKSINITKCGAQVLVDCVGASGTLALGAVGSTSLLIAATAIATLVAATPIWTSTTPVAVGQSIPALMKDMHLANANIIATIATTAFSAGAIFFWVEYQAAFPGSYLSLS